MTFIRAAAGANFDVQRTNSTGGALAEGTVVSPGAADEIVATVIADPSVAASRPVGVISETGGIGNGLAGNVRVVAGSEASALLVTGLLGTVSVGDEIIASATAGRGTLSKAGGTAQPVSGNSINRLGVVISLLTYDGAGDDLVKIQLDFSARRIK